MADQPRILHIVDPSTFVVRQNSIHRTPKWWACPVDLSMRAQRLLGDHPNGAAHYGIWCLLVSYAAKRHYRWTITTSDGDPVPTSDLAWAWRVPSSLVEEAINRFIEIGWAAYEEPTRLLAATVRNETNGTDVTNETKRDETNGVWGGLAIRLGLGVGGISRLRAAMEAGVSETQVYSALRDQIDSGKALRSPDAWAKKVASNLVNGRES